MSTRDGYEDDAWGGRSPERSVSSSESRSRSRFRRHLYPRSRAQVSSRREPVAKLTPARPPIDPVESHEAALRQTDRPVLCFPAIDVRNELNSKLAQALFKVAHPKGPYTHEVFMILCAHNGDKSDAAKGGIWQVVRGACSHYGIAYKEYVSYGHEWYETIGRLVRTYDVTESLNFLGQGRCICVGAASRSEERKKALALSCLIAYTYEHRDLQAQVAAYNEGIDSVLRALSLAAYTAKGKTTDYRDLRLVTALFVCTASTHPVPAPDKAEDDAEDYELPEINCYPKTFVSNDVAFHDASPSRDVGADGHESRGSTRHIKEPASRHSIRGRVPPPPRPPTKLTRSAPNDAKDRASGSATHPRDGTPTASQPPWKVRRTNAKSGAEHMVNPWASAGPTEVTRAQQRKHSISTVPLMALPERERVEPYRTFNARYCR